MRYLNISDLRTIDKVSVRKYPDELLNAKIQFVEGYIDKITDQFFDRQTLELYYDGDASELLVLDYPIIEITEIAFKQSLFGQWDIRPLTDFSIYNRIKPDDRKYPRIKISQLGVTDNIYASSFNLVQFPGGTQNIRIKGDFGFMDYVSGQYVTPEPIKLVARMLLNLYIDNPFSPLQTFRKKLRGKGVKSERADKHSFTLQDSMAVGRLTGDPEIDTILKEYMKPSKASLR